MSWGEGPVGGTAAPCPYAIHGVCLPDRLFEGLPGREADDATLWNLDCGAGLRVARRARLPLARLEGAEPDEGDRVAFLQRLGNAVDHRLDGGRGARLGRPGVLGDLRNQFLLVHQGPPRSVYVDAAVIRFHLGGVND